MNTKFSSDSTFGRMALKHKLLGGFGAVMLSMAAGTIFSVIEIRSLTRFVSKAAEIHEMTEVAALSSDMIGFERAIVLYSTFADRSNTKRYKKRLDESSRTFDSVLAAVGHSAASDGTRQMIKPLREKYGAWMAMHRELMDYLDKQQVDLAEKKVA